MECTCNDNKRKGKGGIKSFWIIDQDGNYKEYTMEDLKDNKDLRYTFTVTVEGITYG